MKDKKIDDLFEKLIGAVDMASLYAVLGGDASEFVRFLQLEWESFDHASTDKEQIRRFYRELEVFKKHHNPNKRNWRTDFSGRDFSKLVV